MLPCLCRMAKYTIYMKMVLYYCLSAQVSLTAILGEISPFLREIPSDFLFLFTNCSQFFLNSDEL